ncbi:cyclic peptide export ABC transporter [Microvirga brassicacearum]|uniref:Cyclic peptide export ABC transporter n=1 Tax=Microvirga brassicacearum TaxID=2580413 RepID=A0A5N3P6Q9_9HYPH|nr:cyclic peptide export ABC transporter [Microvirga brassicacearum]KAB0265424.1 cyclic peptide export ABC transporter [Microvirga brassicacearum]
MKFIKLLFAEAGDGRTRLLLISILPGIVMAVVIALVTTVSNNSNSEELHVVEMGFFVLGCATVLFTMNRALNAMTALVSGFLDRTRQSIAQQVRRLDLTAYERIGPTRINEAVGRDLQTIDETAPAVVALIYFVMQLVASALYIGYLSVLAFGVTLVCFAAAAYFYRRSYTDAEDLWKAATASESAFRLSLDHLLAGFREVKLNARRSDDLFANYIVARSHEVERLRVESGRGFNRGQTVSDIFFYALMGAIVFAIPHYVSEASVPSKITLVIVFSSGAIGSIIRTLPMVARANVAVESLHRLEQDLAAATPAAPNGNTQGDAAIFDSLNARALTYTYTDPAGGPAFSVGPCDFQLTAGETVFIVGGNGSGKSTLIKLLTALYEPDSGSIRWDGTPVTGANVEAYRSLFTVIFADFHLFDRLYGIDEVDHAALQRLLVDMRLDDKVSFQDGRFSTTDLSSGQRKRLAMVVSRLENRPICIFDEWAADQDPEFRKYYYEVLLPELKAEGRAVIAITHDDRYFHFADRLVWMDEGQITRVEKTGVEFA